jgi:hypothetical protein
MDTQESKSKLMDGYTGIGIGILRGVTHGIYLPGRRDEYIYTAVRNSWVSGWEGVATKSEMSSLLQASSMDDHAYVVKPASQLRPFDD